MNQGIKKASLLFSFKAILFVFIFSINCTNAIAVSDSLKAEMRKISDTLYHIGNIDYIVIDAICDGFLEPGTEYTLTYAYGFIGINSSRMPESYVTKLRCFYAENFRKFNNHLKIVSNGINITEIFDTSAFSKVGGSQTCIMIGIGGQGILSRDQSRNILSELETMLMQDKYIDTAFYYEAVFDYKGLFVNGKKIDGQKTVSYATSLKQAGFDINNTGALIKYNNDYRKECYWHK